MKATFGLGCFWSPQLFFEKLNGVTSTTVGYAGGTKENPSYHLLGDHTETIEIEFNPKEISYDELLNHFWKQHDYTRQPKTRYKSLILYNNERQKAAAERSKPKDAATVIKKASHFYRAENYHQDFLKKHALARMCHNILK